MESGESKNLVRGRLISNRLENASREVSSVARWIDSWVENPVEAIGNIFDIGNSQSQGAEAVAIQELVFGKDPIIDATDFSVACVGWLNSKTHDIYQYRTLFQILEQGDTFLVPEVLEWYIKNLDNLKKIFSYPESYDPFIEMIEFLATGKTLKEHKEWWMNRVRGNMKKGKEQNIK
jgi:hypothetical protein